MLFLLRSLLTQITFQGQCSSLYLRSNIGQRRKIKRGLPSALGDMRKALSGDSKQIRKLSRSETEALPNPEQHTESDRDQESANHRQAQGRLTKTRHTLYQARCKNKAAFGFACFVACQAWRSFTQAVRRHAKRDNEAVLLRRHWRRSVPCNETA